MSRVHVLGNAGMDLGLALPRMPLPGETLVGCHPHRAPGGKGLNQAVTAARSGASVRFAAPLGDDPEAAEIAAAMQAEPFETLDLPRRPGATDRSILMLTPDGENCIVSLGACAGGFDPAAAARFAAGVAPADILLMQGNLSFAATEAAMGACAGRVMLNTAPLMWDMGPLLPRCTIVVANAVEARAITGSDRAAACRNWRRRRGNWAIATRLSPKNSVPSAVLRSSMRPNRRDRQGCAGGGVGCWRRLLLRHQTGDSRARAAQFGVAVARQGGGEQGGAGGLHPGQAGYVEHQLAAARRREPPG